MAADSWLNGFSRVLFEYYTLTGATYGDVVSDRVADGGCFIQFVRTSTKVKLWSIQLCFIGGNNDRLLKINVTPLPHLYWDRLLAGGR